MRRTTGLVLALLAPLAFAACNGGDEAEEVSPQDRLAEAKTSLDETSGVHLTLSADELPAGVNGLLAAQGIGTHAPAFEGDIQVSTNGLTAKADVIAVDDKVYAVLPFTSDYAEIDPDDYQAPDPAVLMSTEGGLSSLLTAAEDVQASEDVRDGQEVLSTFTGTVPGKAVARVIPSAEADADFDATFTLDDDNQLSRVVMSGPFYPGTDPVTYTIALDRYGTDKDIQAP